MKLTFYMKSGNKIEVGCVKGYEFNYRGDEITGVKIVRHWWAPKRQILLVGTLSLSQIEAVRVN